MWTMYTAPSDRDYYGEFDDFPELDEPDFCLCCGAYESQACEEWCDRNASCGEVA